MSSLADQPVRMTSVPFNVPRRTSSSATRCATPECHRKRGHGMFGCFCRPCARRLKAIREQIEAELHATTRWGGINTIPGTTFCDACEAEGYMEEAA